VSCIKHFLANYNNNFLLNFAENCLIASLVIPMVPARQLNPSFPGADHRHKCQYFDEVDTKLRKTNDA
jgi:hypothetical protein